MNRFIARLVTQRPMERGVQLFGSTQSSVTAEAVKWMNGPGEKGDTFEIFEVVQQKLCSIRHAGRDTAGMAIIAAGNEVEAAVSAVGLVRHQFVKGSGAHCDRCGSSAAHIAVEEEKNDHVR